jgi:hypothetical protein
MGCNNCCGCAWGQPCTGFTISTTAFPYWEGGCDAKWSVSNGQAITCHQCGNQALIPPKLAKPKPKPLVYIAAPYTKGDQVKNCRDAMLKWDHLRVENKVTPICPHWSAYQQLLLPLNWDQWLAYDFEIISRCDAVLRLAGESKGAEAEEEHARSRGIPVFYSVGKLYEWVDER